MSETIYFNEYSLKIHTLQKVAQSGAMCLADHFGVTTEEGFE
jgi:hypothetical protein